MSPRRTFRDTLAAGDRVIGLMIALRDPLAAEMTARSTCDFVCLDAQHGDIHDDDMTSLLQAISAVGTPTLVRVPNAESSTIGAVLDAGADGVIIPEVDSSDSVATALSGTLYAPRGTRSYGPLRAGLVAGSYEPEHLSSLPARLVMVESERAVDNIAAIAKVADLDGVLIGPFDLCLSLGIAPGFVPDDAGYWRACKTVIAACAEGAVATLVQVSSPREATPYLELGVSGVLVGIDALLLRRASTEAVRGAREVLSGQNSRGEEVPG